MTQDLIVKDYPALRDIHEYAAFKRKWEYLFAYAGAGFAKGYITCHMLTFIRQLSSIFSLLFTFSNIVPLPDRTIHQRIAIDSGIADSVSEGPLTLFLL